MVHLLQVQRWSVSGTSGVTGGCWGASCTCWKVQSPLHQSGAFLQLCRYSGAKSLLSPPPSGGGSPEWIIGLHLTLSFVSTFVFVDTSTAPPKSSRPGPSRQLQRWPESRGGRWKRGGLISLWTHCTTFLMRLGVFINDGKALFHYIFYSHCTLFLHRFNIFLFCNIFYINRSGLSFSRVPRETLRQIEQQVENHTEGTASSLLHFIRHNRFVVTLVFGHNSCSDAHCVFIVLVSGPC